MQNSVNGLQGPPKFSLKCRTFIQFPYKKRLKSLITCCLFIENWLNNSKVLHLSSERHPHCEQGGWSPINQGKKTKIYLYEILLFPTINWRYRSRRNHFTLTGPKPIIWMSFFHKHIYAILIFLSCCVKVHFGDNSFAVRAVVILFYKKRIRRFLWWNE